MSYTHDGSMLLISRVFKGESEGLTRDDILDNITIAWLTNTALSGASRPHVNGRSRLQRRIVQH